MATNRWTKSPLKGLNNNLSLSMLKRKLCQVYLEERTQARKRNICEIQPISTIQPKRLHSYPEFDILAAHYKGSITRTDMSRKKYLFYTI